MRALEKEQLPHLSLGEERNMVTQLLIINFTIFVFLFFTLVIYKMENYGEVRFYKDIMTWLRLPADFSKTLVYPWTIITSLFTHITVWQLFTNMAWLWCFGTFMQHLAGYQRIVPLYLFGGICGNLFYVAGMQLIPAFHAIADHGYTIGAAGSVMAIAVGVTSIAPRYRIFPLLGGGISLWIITMLFVILSVGSLLIASDNGVTYIPELAGSGLAGWIYMNQWKKGHDWGAGFNRLTFKLLHLFHPANQQIILEDLTKNNLVSDPTHQPFKHTGKIPEQRINEILDKINERGLSSLSAEEKATLLKASKTA